MKILSSNSGYKIIGIGRNFRHEVLSKVVIGSRHDEQVRCMHESYLPKGHGGRSSFSGVVATVFGSTGFLGHAVLNHLAATGTNVMIPYRGTFDRVQRMRVMSDLGQFNYREKFSIKQSDDVVFELIEHSNCVINLIKARKPYNHYTMEEVNLEWPRRLANLVAAKSDGTRLIHMTHLNCHQEYGRNLSNILRQDYEAENILKEIYPATTIVRCSGVHGFNDNYIGLFCHKGFEQDLSFAGACPVLYDAGRSTIIQPVYLSDVAEGVSRLAKHPDAPGHTFEFVGPDRFTLHDFLEHIFELKSYERIAPDKLEFFDFNSIGPLDRSKATLTQKLFHLVVEDYFKKMFRPRLLPRFMDMISRGGSKSTQWMSFDLYKQFHLTDRTTGAPGLQELGIEPAPFEEKAFDYLCQLAVDFKPRSGKIIPRAGPEPGITQTKEIQHLVA